MGSGKGKSRRSQSSESGGAVLSSVPSGALYEEMRWESFLQSSGVEDVPVLSYYFDDIHAGAVGITGMRAYNLAVDDYKKVVTELFMDAVNVRAIRLPSPYSAEDFVFEMESRPTYDDETVYVNIALKSKPNSGMPILDPTVYINTESVLSDGNTHYVLQVISWRINELLGLVER